jgi:hypothetical protein
MFDPQKWIQQSWSDDDTKIVKIGADEAKIRRLKGSEWEQYMRAINGKTEDSSIAIVLQFGLVRAFGHYTYEEMLKLFDASPMVAEKLASKILDLTMERMSAEQKALEDAEKNSEATTTELPSGDGAEHTDKTHELQS